MLPEARPFSDTPTDQIEAEILGLERKRDEFRRQPRRFRSDTHDAIDDAARNARVLYADMLRQEARRLSRSIGMAFHPDPAIAGVRLLATDPAFLADLHQAVDETPAGDTFVAIDRPEYEAAMTLFASRIAERRQELRIRELKTRTAADAAELGAMEVSA